MRKKILLLGGSAQQVAVIRAACQMGYYTVLCDYLPDNPGQFEADKFYLVSTTDKGAVLQVAISEKIDGIIAYSSDPAAPTAAYVSKQMGLPGVPFDTAENFCNKSRFREFLRENGFHVPKSVTFSVDSPVDILKGLDYPIIVKPTDSSGSKGVTVIEQPGEFEIAKQNAGNFSASGQLIAEEFIIRDHSDVIEAEIFVVNGEVAVWGLINSIRDSHTNPLLPAAYSYPLNVSDARFDMVKREVSQLVVCSKVKHGAFNIEMVISPRERLYFLDAGPRNGGNMLPEFIGHIKKMNLVKATVCAAVGDIEELLSYHMDGREGGFWGLAVIHADRDGVFSGVWYSEQAKKCLFRECLFVKNGDDVHPFRQSRDAVGLAFFSFPSREIQDQVLRDFTGAHIKVLLN